jgi:hypothetical protein
MPTSPDDIAVRGWGPVTVRVAWVLRTEGIKVTPDAVRDARDHVWLHLDPDTAVDDAEDKAEALVRAFVARALQRPWREQFPEDRDLVLKRTWRDPLYRGLSRNARWVLLRHCADGYALEQIAGQLKEDVLALEAAREGLREVLRRTAKKDGVDLDDVADDRLDHLLHRLAQMAPAEGPPLTEVVDGLHPDHTQRCVRSSRAFRLVRSGELRRADLLPPEDHARPTSYVRVLALHFHPAARAAKLPLSRELGARSFPLPDDLVLVDAADDARLRDVLQLAAEVGAPEAAHLRGAFFEAPGRWSRHGLVGPAVDRAQAQIRSLSWGSIEGLGELPEKLPEPPSARRAWVAVAGLAAVAALLVPLALRPAPVPRDHPLQVEALAARKGWWVDFDVDEDAYVFVVAHSAEGTKVVLDSGRIADKIRVATGDGGYRLHTLGDGVLVASASHALPELGELVAASVSQPQPLDWLADQLHETDPRIDVRLAE